MTGVLIIVGVGLAYAVSMLALGVLIQRGRAPATPVAPGARDRVERIDFAMWEQEYNDGSSVG